MSQNASASHRKQSWPFGSFGAAAVIIALGLAGFFTSLILCGCGNSRPSLSIQHGSKVTFVVTGDDSNVNYGTINVNVKVNGPMRRSMAVKDYHTFSVAALLKHAGHVECKILLDGKQISANHGSDSAICAITRNSGNGSWIDLTS